ncbi:ABC transporter permease [Clostridium niameyense]|uniref:ABC transporter permease n=1 Tax=Clostridium niameyense TaxID=1622073 RepID=A0A6M0R9H3_9CLOT|nr:ABC transporter permease subunit [Clostridium niameyense]NEZ46239.1 ABC transporter permease [Clostridium niameyense]
MDVFLQEIKRQLNFKRFINYILIVIMLAILWTWFIVGSATEDFMQTGCYKGHRGKGAIELAAKDRNVTAGKMTEDKFQKGCEIFLNALKGNDESDLKITKDLLQYAVYSDKLVMQNFRLKKMRGESTKDVCHISKDFGRHFYENEDLYYKNYINQNAKNEKEVTIALAMWDKVEKPYTYYSGFEIWDDGIAHIVFFSFVLMIIIGVFSGSIIASDKESEVDEIIKSTPKGRRNLIVAKIVIPLIMSVVIYLCGVGIYILLLKSLLPKNALNTSIQVLGITSFLPYNVLELLKKTFIFGAIGTLTTASFSTWISSIVKKSSRAIEISVLTTIGAFLIFVFVKIDNPIMDIIKIFIPGGIVFSDIGFEFPFITFMGKVFSVSSIFIVSSVIIFLFSMVFTLLNYMRR